MELAGITLLATTLFIGLGKLVIFDDWQEFLSAFDLVRRSRGDERSTAATLRAEFAATKLVILISFTAILSYFGWMLFFAG
jgi:hypothetical protein